MITIVAFTGQAGAGKDSAADYLVEHARFYKLAFADALRAEVAEAFELEGRREILSARPTKEQPHDALALRHCKSFCFIGAVAMADKACVNSEWLDAPRSPRQILQWWGTEYRRAEDPNYWVQRLGARLAVSKAGGHQRYVVTDCRFLNEAQYIRANGGVVWRVDRPDLPAVEGSHASGHSLDPDYISGRVRNTAKPEDLRIEVLRHWWAYDSKIDVQRLRVEVAA